MVEQAGKQPGTESKFARDWRESNDRLARQDLEASSREPLFSRALSGAGRLIRTALRIK